MLRDSVVVVVRTRPRAIPLAMITIRKILYGFPFLYHDAYGAPLGGPSGRRSTAKNRFYSRNTGIELHYLETGACPVNRRSWVRIPSEP